MTLYQLFFEKMISLLGDTIFLKSATPFKMFRMPSKLVISNEIVGYQTLSRLQVVDLSFFQKPSEVTDNNKNTLGNARIEVAI